MIARWLCLIGHWRAGPDAIRIVSLRLLLHMMGPLLLGCRKQGMHASHVGIHKSFLSKRAQNSSYSTLGLTAYVHLIPVQAWYPETYQHSSKHGFKLLKNHIPFLCTYTQCGLDNYLSCHRA